jgi:DNA-binding XRE family transcriptional regulator
MTDIMSAMVERDSRSRAPALADADNRAAEDSPSGEAEEGAKPPARKARAHRGEREGLPVVGENVRRCRRERGLSLDALAKESGVSRSMLGQIELGQSVPTIHVLWKIAQAFRVPVMDLVTVKDDVVPSDDASVLADE